MPPESRPLLVLVTFHVRPDRIEEWKTVHRQIWTPVGEEKECIMFDVYESKEDIGVFRLIEVWDGTKEWFENVSESAVPATCHVPMTPSPGPDEEGILQFAMGEEQATVDKECADRISRATGRGQHLSR